MRFNLVIPRFSEHDGYGRLTRHFVRTLLRKGVTVKPVPSEILKWDGFLQRAMGVDFTQVTLSMTTIPELKPVPGRHWLYSMWETTKFPADWKEKINDTVERVLVPSEWVAQIFKANGVKRPIHIVPLGIDPDEFHVIQSASERPFTFLCLGDRAGRKGDDRTLWAYSRAFRDVEDTRLIIKSRRGEMGWMDNSSSTDPITRRLILWREDAPRVADVYAMADCFVFPSKAEGWGLPPREAAAMGIPTIVTRYSGLTDGIDGYATVALEHYEMCDVPKLPGKWAHVDDEELCEAMLWVYQHREAAREKARASAEWLRQHQTWDHATDRLIEVLEEWA